MTEPLHQIHRFKEGDKKILKAERWLMFIGLTFERRINLERVYSLKETENNYVLDYVQRTLERLQVVELDQEDKEILMEVLKWSEVAKTGLPHQRKEWIEKGYNLFAHNEGSAAIYLEHSKEEDKRKRRVIHTLILTHGLIGQYIRGEVNLEGNSPLYQLVKEEVVTEKQLERLLFALNECIISAADDKLWSQLESRVMEVIKLVIKGDFDKQYTLKERLRELRKTAAQNGEDFEQEYHKILENKEIKSKLEALLGKVDLWYVEAALYDFTFEEFIKMLLIAGDGIEQGKMRHLSFEKLMQSIYYEHVGKKRINIYKKRIIEKYLLGIDLKKYKNELKENVHVRPSLSIKGEMHSTAFFDFSFSSAGEKLIDFCVEAEKADVLYEKAIILLFDLFELRKDKYDRFYEEESYLSTMNQTIDYKKIILDYIIGDKVVDIGPGGGALMDLIEDTYKDKEVIGVDIAQNVLDALKKKKNIEGKKWQVLYGDALNLKEYIAPNSIDTIIFCSILHELFSYIPYNGKKFNYETLEAAFKSAFEVLKPGGRIIIRDGIMTEPEGQKRIIKFLSEEGVSWLKRYKEDFKGREIHYTLVRQNEVLMPVNDAMEFLYTYTWGEKSYLHEINEQFGYFTPSGFRNFIKRTLGEKAKIIVCKHFLQEGYTVALSQKVSIFDEERNPVALPDSTCLIVIEKARD